MRQNQNLSEKITVKVTKESKMALEAEADNQNCCLSDLVREKLQKSESCADPAILRQLCAKLMKTGNDLGRCILLVRTSSSMKRGELVRMLEQIQKEEYEAWQSLN